MELVEQIADMTIRMEQHEDDRQEIYTLLLQAMLEIRLLNYRISVLKSELGYSDP